MTLTRVLGTNNQRYLLSLGLSNGEYIDEGVLEIELALEASTFRSVRPEEKTIALKLSKSQI